MVNIEWCMNFLLSLSLSLSLWWNKRKPTHIYLQEWKLCHLVTSAPVWMKVLRNTGFEERWTSPEERWVSMTAKIVTASLLWTEDKLTAHSHKQPCSSWNPLSGWLLETRCTLGCSVHQLFLYIFQLPAAAFALPLSFPLEAFYCP